MGETKSSRFLFLSHTLLRRAVVVLASLHLNPVSAQWDLRSSLQSDHFLVPSDLRHKNQWGLRLDVDNNSKSWALRMGAFLSPVKDTNWAFVDEFYFSSGVWTVGKKRLDLFKTHPVEGVQLTGRAMNLVAWEPLDPETQGLVQVSQKWRLTSESFVDFGIAPIWIPSLYAFPKQEGTRLFSPNRWSSLPPQSVNLNGRSFDLQLKQPRSEILSDAFSSPRVWLIFGHKNLRGLYTFGPETGYRTKTDGVLDFNSEDELIVNAQISAELFYAHIFGIQGSWQLTDSLKWVQEVSGMYRLNSTDTAYFRSHLAQGSTGLILSERIERVEIESWSAAVFTHRLSEQSVAENESFDSRFAQTISLARAPFRIKFIYDRGFAHQDERISTSASYEAAFGLFARLGLDLLRSKDGLGYWGRYQKADRAQIILGYRALL
jgi:hypothetical protein